MTLTTLSLRRPSARWPARRDRRRPASLRLALTATLLALAPSLPAQQAHEFVGTSVEHPGLALALGDVDGDGLADLATSGNTSGSTTILLGQGDGSFASQSNLPINAWALAFGHMDAGNSDLDLVTTSVSGAVTAHLGNGSGGFTSGPSTSVLSMPPSGALISLRVELADFDGDGATDVAAALSVPATASFLMGDGAGNLSNGSIVPLPGSSLRGVVPADMDNDGDLDAIAGAGGVELTWLDNDGAGNFSVLAQLGDLLPGPSADLFGVDVQVADLDNDGDTDVLFSQTIDHDIGVLLNDGAGGFAAPLFHGVGDSPERMAITDLDGDGVLDVLAANSHDARLLVVRGDGNGGLSTESTWPLSGSLARLALADIDGDGDDDVAALAASSGHLDVLLDAGPGAFANLGGGILQDHDLPAVLTGAGPMTVGSANQLELVYQQSAVPVLVAGVSPLQAPFKGGVMVPHPDALLMGLPVGPDGEVVVPFVVPNTSLPGDDMWVQHWFPYLPGPAGWAASNGLRATVQ